MASAGFGAAALLAVAGGAALPAQAGATANAVAIAARLNHAKIGFTRASHSVALPAYNDFSRILQKQRQKEP